MAKLIVKLAQLLRLATKPAPHNAYQEWKDAAYPATLTPAEVDELNRVDWR